MLEELKNRARKSGKKTIILCAVLIVALMVVPLLAPIRLLLGPKDLTEVKNLDYNKYMGKYVEFEVKYVFDYYMEQISKNTKTGAKKTTGYGYIVYNYEDNSCFAVYLPKKHDKLMNTLMDQAANIYYYGIEGSKSIKIKGTLELLTGSELRYYKESLEDLEEYIPGITDTAVMCYVNSESVNHVPVALIYMIYMLCVGALIRLIYMAICLGSGKSERQLKKFLADNPSVTESQIESDMNAAVNIANTYWVGKAFTIWREGIKIRIIDNSKLVWAYYYRVNGRHSVSQVWAYNINKKRTAINMSAENAQKMLNAFLENQPQMVVDYSTEIEKKFLKDFEGFLNIAYNPYKNGAADGYNNVYGDVSQTQQESAATEDRQDL